MGLLLYLYTHTIRYNSLIASFTLDTHDLFFVHTQSRTCDTTPYGVALHTTINGLTVCEFHHDGTDVPIDAYFSDVILCCHPELLPPTLRVKHPAPVGYKGTVATGVGGGFDELVTINIYAE